MTIDVSLCSIEDIQFLSCRHMDSLWSHCSFHHLVDDSDICEGSSGHDEVIASS